MISMHGFSSQQFMTKTEVIEKFREIAIASPLWPGDDSIGEDQRSAYRLSRREASGRICFSRFTDEVYLTVPRVLEIFTEMTGSIYWTPEEEHKYAPISVHFLATGGD
ncbi:MAG TPA: hypothetical protein VN886_19395 [Acidimicrobiales bacterium]|nr:hypothetical protein [Acidimicrobiales bacterium]